MILKSVTIGSVTLAAGVPKIGVTLAGAKQSTLLGAAAQVLTSAAQIVEWRLDDYEELDNRAALVNTATQLQQILGTIPVIATLSATATDAATYYDTYRTLVNNRAAAAMDIDLAMTNQDDFVPLTKQMRAQGIKLILSATYQDQVPTLAELEQTYQTLAAAGGDIARIKVVARQPLDVLTLMAATAQARADLTLPLIATTLGTLGRYNSVCGQLIGSAVTFGRVGRVGGTGQLPVSQLKQTLQTLATAEGA